MIIPESVLTRRVSTSVCASLSLIDPVSFASPKSRILTRPSCVMKRFSGFRSR
jgi:hypothetical protein